MEPISKETDTVGLKISTKAVGFNRRNDITDEYKHPEGKTARYYTYYMNNNLGISFIKTFELL